MLELPDVTLVLIETRQHDLAELALKDCERKVSFGDVLVFTDRVSQFQRADRRVIPVSDWDTKLGWSKCFWMDVPLHVRTSHALCIQWDSWVVDTSAWQDCFLQYDFVGAPWWYQDGLNVGNGGFCLRSSRMMRYIRKHRGSYPVVTDLDDDLFCRRYRPGLQAVGFEWAPEPIAQAFAFEIVRPNKDQKHFGFHAVYNFNYGCEGDEERAIERAKLMRQSEYFTKTHKYLWGGMVKAFPWIEERLGIEPMEAEGGR